MKQRYFKVNHELIPVTEEVYQAHTRAKESERYRARRDGRCGQSNYHLCSGDCASCPWQQEGYRVISLHKALGPELEHETPELNTTASSLDDVVADRLLLEQLYRQLDELIPDGSRVFRLLRARDRPQAGHQVPIHTQLPHSEDGCVHSRSPGRAGGSAALIFLKSF